MTSAVRTSARAAAVVAVGLLALPAAGLGAVKHAAPNGFGFSCTAAQPCTISTALDQATAADEVSLAGGNYDVAGLGTLSKRINLHGAPGALPVLHLGQPQNLGECGIELDGGTIRDVRIHNKATAHAICSDGNVVIERVGLWTDGLGGTGIQVLGATDATIASTSISMAGGIENGILLGNVKHATLEHVTVESAGAALQLNQPTDDGKTSIVASYLKDGGSLNDIVIACNAQAHVIETKASAFDSIDDDCTHVSAGGDMSRAGVSWTGFSQGVLRPGANSPLIDAAPASAADARDVDGDPRTLGNKADIGADELYQAPLTSVPTATKVTATTADVWSYVRRLGATVDVWVEYFAQPATQYKIAATLDPSTTILGQLATGKLTGLTPQTTYTARVIVKNAGGQMATSTDVTFTTAATPPSGEGTTSGGAADPTQPASGATGTADAGAGQPGSAQPPAGPAPSAGRDVRGPACILKARRTERGVLLKGTCDEAGKLKVKLSRTGGRSAVTRTVVVRKPGVLAVTLRVSAVKRVSFRASDALGNTTKLAKVKLRR